MFKLKIIHANLNSLKYGNYYRDIYNMSYQKKWSYFVAYNMHLTNYAKTRYLYHKFGIL